MRLDEMSDEQLERLDACETPEEEFAYLREQGVELTDEELAEISGGMRPPYGRRRKQRRVLTRAEREEEWRDAEEFNRRLATEELTGESK